MPNGPEALSEGQPISISAVDTLLHSLQPDFPLCSGTLYAYPDPRVRVSFQALSVIIIHKTQVVATAQAVTSLPPVYCSGANDTQCPALTASCGNIMLQGITGIDGFGIGAVEVNHKVMASSAFEYQC